MKKVSENILTPYNKLLEPIYSRSIWNELGFKIREQVRPVLYNIYLKVLDETS